MMTLTSLDTRKRVILLKEQGFFVSKIIARLKQEQIFVTHHALFKKHSETGHLVDLSKWTRTRKITDKMVTIIDEALSNNDKLTGRKL